jgi:predicted transcriptional regulator
MPEVLVVVVAQVQQILQAARAAPLAVEMPFLQIPVVQAHLVVQALEVADVVLPALEARAEIGEQLVLQARQVLRQVAPQVLQYKDGLRLVHLRH